MSYREDLNALYARADALERDLERARAELAELRGQPRPPREDREFPAGELIVERRPFAEQLTDERRAREAPVADGVLALLESRHSRSDPAPLGAEHEFEDGIGRAIELLVPELIARHRGVRGDGTHAQLLGLLDLLVALWREHSSGAPPAEPRSWSAVERLTHGWEPHNELARVLRQLGDYYCRPR